MVREDEYWGFPNTEFATNRDGILTRQVDHTEWLLYSTRHNELHYHTINKTGPCFGIASKFYALWI